jgi:hypothetical protein
LPKKPSRPTINKNLNISKNDNRSKSKSLIAAFDLDNDDIIQKNELVVAIDFLQSIQKMEGEGFDSNKLLSILDSAKNFKSIDSVDRPRRPTLRPRVSSRNATTSNEKSSERGIQKKSALSSRPKRISRASTRKLSTSKRSVVSPSNSAKPQSLTKPTPQKSSTNVVKSTNKPSLPKRPNISPSKKRPNISPSNTDVSNDELITVEKLEDVKKKIIAANKSKKWDNKNEAKVFLRSFLRNISAYSRSIKSGNVTDQIKEDYAKALGLIGN